MINLLIIVLRAVAALANALIRHSGTDPPVHRLMNTETIKAGGTPPPAFNKNIV